MNKIKINIDINHIARYAHSAKISSKKKKLIETKHLIETLYPPIILFR